jgi:hypothetical protein
MKEHVTRNTSCPSGAGGTCHIAEKQDAGLKIGATNADFGRACGTGGSETRPYD